MTQPTLATRPRPTTSQSAMDQVRGAVAMAGLFAVVSVVLTGCASSTTAPSGSPGGSAAPSASTAESEPLGLGGIDWVYTPPPLISGGPEGSYPLQAGTLADDAPIVDLLIPWRAELGAGLARAPAIGAPHGGAVVYVADDGATSEIHRVQIVADGVDDVLALLDEVIWDIVVAPDGSSAYAAIVDRVDTARDLGVVRIPLDGSGAVEPFLPPALHGAAGEIRRVAVLAFQVQLAISSDGQHLVRRACAEAGSCVVEVAEAATGRVLELSDREVLGVVAGVIVARGCDGQACSLQAIDIESGAAASAGVDISGRVIEVNGDPVVVAVVSDGRGTTTVEAVNPASGRHHVIYRPPGGAEIGYSDFLDLQMDLPDGLIHLVQMTGIADDGAVVRVDERHLLLSVNDGRAVEIPRPAFRRPDGFGAQG